MVRRSSLALFTTIGAAVTLAPTASAAVTITSSARQVVGGQQLTVKVTSDSAGEIVIRQARNGTKRDVLPSCTIRDTDLDDGPWYGGPALKKIDYTTPGVPVTVKINTAQLGFFGGDLTWFLAANSRPGQRCYDPPTQFTRISAWQIPSSGGDSLVGYAPLTRLI